MEINELLEALEKAQQEVKNACLTITALLGELNIKKEEWGK